MPPTKRKTTAAKPAKPVPAAANDREELGLVELARGILARELRPLAGHVRRLAEAVLVHEEKRAKKKAGGGKKDGKKHKLAKIPGQKGKK
jgi:hypothetical protein